MTDEAKHENLIREKLGLGPVEPPNITSQTMREFVSDLPSALAYCRSIVDLVPEPPRRFAKAAVRDFYLAVYAWANFWYGAVGAFMDAVDDDSLGLESARELLHPSHNVAGALFAGIGVDVGLKVHPGPFATSARTWNAADRQEALRAVATAEGRLHRVLDKMRTFLPSPKLERPPLNETDLLIAEAVFLHGPLLGKHIVEHLPPGKSVLENRIFQVMSRKLVRHYGFTNRKDGRGYRPPKTRTW